MTTWLRRPPLANLRTVGFFWFSVLQAHVSDCSRRAVSLRGNGCRTPGLVQFFATLGYQGSYTMTAPDQIGSDANRPAPGGCTIRSSVELRLRRSGYAALALVSFEFETESGVLHFAARCRRFT